MKSLYALLVGINDYQKPFKKLKGCIKDVNSINDYIQSNLKDRFSLNVKSLLDGDATYDNVINSFESHLGQAGPEDAVWFHFSGHGSQAWSAEEFHKYDATKRDQTMLCYDSLPDQKFNLADKELAALIHKVANSYPDGRKKDKPPHILISLDCCHSGSGTRSYNSKKYANIRNANTPARERPLSSYANGFFNSEALTIPLAPHINISACRRHEVAGDTITGGAFTTGLIKALKSSPHELTYADLYLKTRATVKKLRKFQSPKFSFLAEMSPYGFFLSPEESGQTAEYEVSYKNGNWHIQYGVIHGLLQPVDKSTKIKILSSDNSRREVGTANFLSAGALQSPIEMDLKFSFRSMFSSMFGSPKNYIGAIKSLPVQSEQVEITGQVSDISKFKSDWNSSENIELTESSDDALNLSLELGDSMKLIDKNTHNKVFESKNNPEIKSAIHKITRWYRFLDLDNSDPLSNIADGLSFELLLHNASKQFIDEGGNAQIVTATYSTKENNKLGISPKIYVRDSTRDYFFYLFYLDEDYSITCHEEESIFRGDTDGDGVTDIDEKLGKKTDHRNRDDFNEAEVTFVKSDFEGEKGLEIDLWKDVKGIAPSEKNKASTVYLKLLVTSSELDYFQFIQGGLNTTRSDSISEPKNRIPDDWATFKIELNVTSEI